MAEFHPGQAGIPKLLVAARLAWDYTTLYTAIYIVSVVPHTRNTTIYFLRCLLEQVCYPVKFVGITFSTVESDGQTIVAYSIIQVL
jgi:hypothetical protein